MQVYKEGTRSKVQGRDGKDADQGQVDCSAHARRGEPQVPQSIGRKVVQDLQRSRPLFSSTLPIENAEVHRQQSRNCKIKNRAKQEHHGKRRCASALQCAQHVDGGRGALRRGQRT